MQKLDKNILFIGLLLGFTGIVFGAFGAHGLKKIVSTEQVASFEAGVRYQMYHALFLLFLAKTNFINSKNKKIILYFITIGILMFSFSIYLLVLQDFMNMNLKFLGPITPFGGLLLLMGWLWSIFAIFSKKT